MFTLADTNPTQITGVLAFTAAACACVLAARRARTAAPVWKWLAVLQWLFAAEIVFGLRHAIHDAVDVFLMDRGWYAERGPLQQGLVIATLVIGGAGLLAAWRWSRSQPAATPVIAPAVLASCATVALFALEIVSLHAIDAVFYRAIGPVMLIAWLWTACAATVVACAARCVARAH